MIPVFPCSSVYSVYSLHYFIHFLIPYELCGNLRGRPNNIKEHLLLNMQASVAYLLLLVYLLVYLLDQWDQLLWVSQLLKGQLHYPLDVNQDLWHLNVLDNWLFQDNVDQFKDTSVAQWGQQSLAIQSLRFNANHIKVANMDSL